MVSNDMTDATVILPPPSALNPIPSLSAALRLDNQEQLLGLLLQHPTNASAAFAFASTTTATPFRQLLVFGRSTLRTLLMRQVLQDPHGQNNHSGGQGGGSKNKKVNWDNANSFPLPRSLQTNVVGCKLLLVQQQQQHRHHQEEYHHQYHTPRTTLQGTAADVQQRQHVVVNTTGSSSKANKPDDDLFYSTHDLFQHIDVVTYFIRPEEIQQTQAVIARIKASSSSTSSNNKNTIHHRIVYIPHISALCRKVLQDAGMMTAHPNVTVTSLQLDLFPLESDVISLEYSPSGGGGGGGGGALRESMVDGTPSPLVTTAARALAKLQDVTGRIGRVQALGVRSEDVLAKLLDTTVDEYLLAAQHQRPDQGDGCVGGDDDDDDIEATMMTDDDANPQQATGDTTSSLVNSNNNVVMMILDRRLDLVTPMVTPLTYEGLLDEVVGISTGFVHVREHVIHPPGDQEEEKNEKDKTKKKKSSSANPFDDGDDDDGGGGVDKASNINKSKLVALGVHAGDTLFAEVRDQHVEKFGSFLQNQAVALKESHQNFTSKGTKKDLNEIHQFVKQIPIFTQNLRSLTNHIHLAELIKATTEEVSFREQWNTERAMIEGDVCYNLLEEWIYCGYPPYKLLRLLCLQSITSGGIKANRYDGLRQAMVQVYGYEFLSVLHDLEACGWIKRKETLFLDANRSAFQSIRRNLILIHAEVDTVEPDDVSYVSSGYAPLSVRLVQSAMQGWSDKEDVLRDVLMGGGGGGSATSGTTASSSSSSLGRLLDVHQTYPPQDLTAILQQQSPPLGSPLGVWAKKRPTKPILIVVYLGGITYMEIAALRFLSKRESFPFHIVMVTTSIINGSKLLQEMG